MLKLSAANSLTNTSTKNRLSEERAAGCRRALFFLLLVGLSIGIAPPAWAAAPRVLATWVSPVQSAEATFHTRLDCGGVATSFRFEYIEETAFAANIGAGQAGFAGAAQFPQPEANAGKCTPTVINSTARPASGLRGETSYVYRVVAHNTDGTVAGPEAAFTTRGASTPLTLPDGRGWEMVSPVDKNGGEIEGSGQGVLQAAAGGGAVTYSSVSSFGEGGEGAPGISQYLARRLPSSWTTQNLSALLSGGAAGAEAEPYQAFSPDLARGVLMGTPNLPLPGTDAPAGYANYYLRDTGGGYTALLGQADVAGLRLSPSDFSLAFVGASPDLEHAVLSTCAALTPDAVEVPAGSGCDATMPNLYESSPGGLRLVNLLPGHSTGTPPAHLAAPTGAVSADGSRVYWTDGTDLYLREGGRTVPVDAAVGGGGSFQLATPDGGVAFFTKGGDLYRFDAASEAVTDLTPGGGVTGVLGASADGSYVYFATAAGIFLAHGGAIVSVAPAPDAINFPPSSGTARVTADGTHLLFVSSTKVTLYDSTDPITEEPRNEVYLYDANRGTTTCVSCNPFGEPPAGSATVPGATGFYKPRSLSADGTRVFFDTPDPLATGQDSDEGVDVYEWEEGVGPRLISSGDSGSATFADASANGADAFFLTGVSLVKSDPGSVDLYDAREGGGFPESPNPIPCEEDACQPLPPPPDDPSPGSLVPSTGNPPVHFPKKKAKKHHRKKRHRHSKGHRHVGG
jgi:Tol biopolymer transport system component